MTDRARDRFTARIGLVAVLVGLVAAAVAPPAGAVPVTAAGVGAEASATAPPSRQGSQANRYVRRLLHDLRNTGDPVDQEVEYLVLLFYIEPAGRTIASRVEELQTHPLGRAAVVDDLFGAVLRRAADPASRAFFVDRLAATGRQKVMADLLASAEHHARQGGGTDAGWVDALYRDALGRPADPAGRQYYVDQLAAGRTRGSIASFFTGGAEGRRALVRRLMVELLRRPADAGSVTYFADRLASGTSVERVITMIATSAEYTAKAMAPPTPLVDVALLLADDRIQYRQLGELAFGQPRTIAVAGLPEGDHLVAIGIRPATESLSGVTAGGQVVALTPGGRATAVGSPLAGFDPAGGVDLSVDPVADRIEIVAGSTVHRVDPVTGAATVATPAYAAGDRHQGAAPDLVGGAFTEVRRGPAPTATTRYEIDTATDALVTRTTGGALTTVGPLHVDVGTLAGFDVSPDAPKAAYAVLDAPEAGISYWRIDLASGEPRLIGFGHDEEVLGLAVIGSPTVASDEAAYGITPGATPQLRRFSTRNQVPTQSWTVVGLTPGTEVLGLDVRPATGDLYGIGSDGQVYGFAFGPGPTTVTASAIGAPLDEVDPVGGLGFDVDPAEDAIRVVDGDRSYEVRIADGVVTADEPVVFHFPEGSPPPRIAGSAFTGSERGAPAPPADSEQAGQRWFFHLDLTEGGWLTWEQPAYQNEVSGVGQLFTEGEVVQEVVGFDISGSLRHTAFALLELNGLQAVVSVDLESGAATPMVILTGAPQRVYSAFALA